MIRSDLLLFATLMEDTTLFANSSSPSPPSPSPSPPPPSSSPSEIPGELDLKYSTCHWILASLYLIPLVLCLLWRLKPLLTAPKGSAASFWQVAFVVNMLIGLLGSPSFPSSDNRTICCYSLERNGKSCRKYHATTSSTNSHLHLLLLPVFSLRLLFSVFVLCSEFIVIY